MVTSVVIPVAPAFAEGESVPPEVIVPESPPPQPTPEEETSPPELLEEESEEQEDQETLSGDLVVPDIPPSEEDEPPAVSDAVSLQDQDVIGVDVASNSDTNLSPSTTTEDESEESDMTDTNLSTHEEVATTTDTTNASGTEVLTPVLEDAEHSEEVIETDSDNQNEASDNIATDTIDTSVQKIAYDDSNLFSFGKNECVSMGNGTFYCTESSEESPDFIADGVFEEKDVGGDKEIFMRTNGEVEQITTNDVEDAAPLYDPLSRTIVWHRLIDGRYQIMSYDLDKKTEEQLTFDRYNNMEPSRSGDITLWQGWVGSDWEIMFLEGDTLTMLTDNTTHDISPHLSGGYIMWQAFEGDSWKVKVYDRVTKQTDTIGDSEGGSVQNPRVVLVYDTKFENGDVETKGYDFASGEVVPLSATPRPVPEEIPDPDQTGEERALVQQQIQVKTKVEESNEPNQTGVSGPPLPNTNSTSTESTSGMDLVVTPMSDATTTGAVTLDTPSASLISDLEVIAPIATDPSIIIEDLVIPPYQETVEL